MSNKNRKVYEPTPGSTIAFKTVFIILFLVLIGIGVMIFLPVAYQATLGSQGFRNGMETFITNLGSKINRWYDFIPKIASSKGSYMCSLVLGLALLTAFVINIYFILKCFSLMGTVKRKHKNKIGVRRLFLAILAVIDLLVLAILVLVPLRNRIGSFGTTLFDLYDKCISGFGSVLAKVKFFTLFNDKLASKPNLIGAFWIFIIFILVNIIYLMFVVLPNKKEKTEEDKQEEKVVEEVAEEKKEVAPTPVAAVAEKEEKTEEEHLVDAVKDSNVPQRDKKKPITRRELAILNTLEPFGLNSIENLPGIYHEDANSVIESLEPKELKETNLPEENSEVGKPVDVLPGVDEWNADPWNEEIIPVEEKVIEPIPPVKEEAIMEDMTSEASEEVVKEDVFEEKEPAPVEEVVEEKTAEPVVEEKTVEVVEETQKEEVIEEVKEDEKVDDEPAYKVIETKPADIDNSWVLPAYDEEAEKRKAEEVAKKAAEEEAKKKAEEEAAAKKAAEEAEAKRLAAEEEAARKAAEEAEAKKKAEEEAAKKAAEEAKPAANVKVVKLNPIHKPVEPANKPKVAPIAPIKREEVSEPAVEEEKKLEKISGPMHEVKKTEAPKDIKPVSARKVKFELSKYRIKTYSGDLTSEEAFLKGVTKVQPTAQPIFVDKNESEWKKKRRQEEIRKNGYENINVVNKTNDLKPIKPISSTSTTTNATSIRDLVKANKAKENQPEVVEEKAEEKKPVKPIAPVKPVEKQEVKPVVEEKKVDVVKPVAPLAVNKPQATNRPKPTAIKPIKPVKPVDTKK